MRNTMLSVVTSRPAIGLLWAGQLFSALGTRLHQMALLWIAVEALGGSAGLVAVAGTAAYMLGGLPGGIHADRADRRRTMIGAELARAAAVATLAVAAARGSPHLAHLAVVGAVLGGLDAFFAPALQASLPALAGDAETLQRANALINVNHRLALIVAPSLAGLLLAVMPITQFFAIDAATFLLSALAIAAIGAGPAWAPVPAASRASGREDLAQAAGLLRHEPVLLWGAALIVTCNLAYGVAWIVGLPLLAKAVFSGGPATYGWLMAAYGVGNVASNLVVGSRSIERHALVLFGGGVVYGAGIIVMGVAPTLSAAFAGAALAAVGGPMTDLMLLLLIQTRIPPAHVGKVLSLRFMVSQASLGGALLLAAPLFAWFSIRVAIAITGAAVIACAVVALWRLRARPA